MIKLFYVLTALFFLLVGYIISDQSFITYSLYVEESLVSDYDTIDKKPSLIGKGRQVDNSWHCPLCKASLFEPEHLELETCPVCKLEYYSAGNSLKIIVTNKTSKAFMSKELLAKINE